MKKIYWLYLLFAPAIWFISEHFQVSPQKLNFIESFMSDALKNNLQHKKLSGFILALSFGFGMNEVRLINKLYLSTFFKFNLLHLKNIFGKFNRRFQTFFYIGAFFFHFSPSLFKKISFDHLTFTKNFLFKITLTSIVILIITPTHYFNVGIFISILYWFTLHLIQDEIWLHRFCYLILTTLLWQSILGVNFSILGFICGQIFFIFYKKLALFFIIATMALTYYPIGIIEKFYSLLFYFLTKLSLISIQLDTSDTVLLFFVILLCLNKKKFYYIIIFFIFKSDWAFTPIIYYSK